MSKSFLLSVPDIPLSAFSINLHLSKVNFKCCFCLETDPSDRNILVLPWATSFLALIISYLLIELDAYTLFPQLDNKFSIGREYFYMLFYSPLIILSR